MQAHVDGNDYSVPVPLIWTKISGDLSWLAKAVDEQQALEEYTASEALDKLLEHHSSGQALLQPFLVAETERGAAFLQSVKEAALAGQGDVAETSTAVAARLGELEARAKEKDAAAMKDQLERLREQQLQQVSGTLMALSEVADPEESKSQNEVLVDRYGEDAVAQMGCEKKDAVYEELIVERISQHETTTYASVAALLRAGAQADNVVSEILSAGEQIQSLEQQAGLAEQRKAEAQDALSALKESVACQEQQRATCEALKKANLKKGDNKRAALRRALAELQQANAEYCSWHVENEILRLQTRRLKAAIDDTHREIEAAEKASQETGSACDKWQEDALREAGKLGERQSSAAKVAVEHLAEAIATTCLNLRVAGELSDKILREKDAEIAGLERDKGLAESEVERLKAQLKEPRQDVRTKRTQLAQQKDKASKCGAQISSCRERLNQVRQTAIAAASQYSSMAELNRHGLGMEEQVIIEEAQRLAEKAYGDLQCFAGSQPPCDQHGLDSGAFAMLPADMKVAFQHLLDEQKKTLTLQFRADMEVRGKPSSGNSPGGHGSDGAALGGSACG